MFVLKWKVGCLLRFCIAIGVEARRLEPDKHVALQAQGITLSPSGTYVDLIVSLTNKEQRQIPPRPRRPRSNLSGKLAGSVRVLPESRRDLKTFFNGGFHSKVQVRRAQAVSVAELQGDNKEAV